VPTNDFAFAATTNSVRIGAEEFFEAQAFYPIMLAATEPIVPVAVLGLEAARNLFVDAQGRWRPGSMCAAIRSCSLRPERTVCCSGSTRGRASFSRSGGQPLFEGSEPSAMTKRALEFCATFQVQNRTAGEFAVALQANDLLVPQQANLSGGPAQPARSLAGFTLIDEARLAALPDDVVLDWRWRNWLGLVYAHLLSQRRWTDLANLPRWSAARRLTSATPGHCGTSLSSTENLYRQPAMSLISRTPGSWYRQPAR
jgi:hypothetical protein